MNMNLKGIMPTLGAKPGQVVSDPYARAFAPQPTIKEAEGEDHEVSMANNSIDTIIKMATELKAKMGEDEKQIPAWIQDHIAKAENLISQASGNYHEYGDSNESVNEARLTDIVRSIVETPVIGKNQSKNVVEAKKYDIGSGYMGNGLTIWNRAEEEHGDYKIIAHISPQGKLSVRDKQLPADLKKTFQIWADSMAKGNMGPKH